MNKPNPFDPTQCVVNDEWYLDFPFPWNAVPQKTEAKTNKILRIVPATLPKFAGDRRTYNSWRGSFIPCVHLTAIDISFKVMFLRSALIPATPRMRELTSTFVGNADGYKEAICMLEDRYGGEEALLMARQETLLTLPALREGDFRLIETFHARLSSFITEWGGLVAGTENPESLAFLSLLVRRFDTSFALKYFEWLQTNQTKKGLLSLKQWLAQQLSHHRQVLHLTKTRALTHNARQAPDTQNSQKPRFPPSSTLDRDRPAATRVFLAQAQDDFDEDHYFDDDPDYAPEPDAVLFSARQNRQQKSSSRPQNASVSLTSVGKKARPPCTICGTDPHPLGRCPKFLEMTPAERRKILSDEFRCFRCFQRGHNLSACRLNYTCVRCGGKHHSLLHDDSAAEQQVMFAADDIDDDEAAGETLNYGFMSRSVTYSGDKRVSLRTIAVWIENCTTGRGTMINALLDDGCNSPALISKSVAQALGLAGPTATVKTQGVGGVLAEYNTTIVRLKISNPSDMISRTILAQVLENPAGSYQPVNWATHKNNYPHIKDLPIPAPAPVDGVDLLLGNQTAYLLASMQEVVGKSHEPIARRTPLGWTVVGPTRPDFFPYTGLKRIPVFLHAARSATWSPSAESAPTVVLRSTTPTDKQLVHLVQKMLEVEDPGETEMLSPAEEYIIHKLRTSLSLSNGQYEVACTWKPGDTRPPYNYTQAHNRLLSLEKSKHFKNPLMKKAYAAAIDDWKQNDFVRPVPLTQEHVKYLIPHFPVFKDSDTTPVRPVMDCKVALNNHLLAGPNFLNEVPDVLLRFRSGLFSLSGDIKQMFLRIRLRKEDRPYHTFLWRADPTHKIQAFQFQVHVFGNTGSPCVAVFVVREHAMKFQHQFPSAVESLRYSSLVDDVLDSVDTIEQARQTLTDIRELLSKAGMTFAKIHSNSTEVLRSQPPHTLSKGIVDLTAACQWDVAQSNLKTLGIRYDPSTDTFSFSMDIDFPSHWTKRKILKVFPRLFDPLGLLLPFTITARIYFSTLAKGDLKWDETIHPTPVWFTWLEHLRDLHLCTFQRCVKVRAGGTFALHIFCDASDKAFAAAAYLVQEQDGQVLSSRLVMARAHVAPAKPTTIPRMELLAAELATKVRRRALKALKMPISKIFHWTDSITVLYWINSDDKRMQKYVHSRIQKIRQNTLITEWKHVPTKLNPADLATRGVSPRQLASSTIWNTGPPFLFTRKYPPAPKLIPTSDILTEMKKEEQVFTPLLHFVFTAVETKTYFPQLSNWKRLLAVVRRLLQWRYNVTLPLPFQVVENALLRLVQQDIRRDIAAHGLKGAAKQWGVTRLTLFVDENGLIRGHGRLAAASVLPRDIREPIIFPKNHPALKALLLHYHEHKLSHTGGVTYALSAFLSRFWTPRARAVTFNTIQNCIPCRRRLSRAKPQAEAPLPLFRLPLREEPAQVFRTTAIDCAGPFKVKRARTYEQHYLLLLTCPITRAVRLEWLSDLTTDAFLLALERVRSKGVHPHFIVSDNGSNFQGAKNILAVLLQNLDLPLLHEKWPTIQWRFNPPYASHYGGVFERLIGAAKASLYHALPSHFSLTLEQLITAFAQVEMVLNQRPLTYVADQETELAPLTPNSFLHGAATVPFVFPPDHADIIPTWAGRWKKSLEIQAAFWRRFQQEVLPHLRLNNKLLLSSRDFKEGDVVCFLHPTSAKKWPLARISRTFPGKDGRVRTLQLTIPKFKGPAQTYQRLQDRVFTRDVGAVALLLPAMD